MNEVIAAVKKVRGNLAARRAQLPFQLVNAPANEPGAVGYMIRGPEITSRTMAFHIDFSKIVLPSKLPAGFKTIEGRALLNQPPVCRITREHGIIGSTREVNHWYFNTLYGIAIVHRSGAVQVTSSGQFGQVLSKLDKIIPGVRNTRNTKISKIDGRIFVNRYINLEAIGPHFARKIASSTGTWSYEPELANRAEVKWKSPSMTLIMYQSGQVQIFGAHKPADAIGVLKTIVRRIGERIVFQTRGNVGGFHIAPARAATKEEKLEALKKSKLDVRHPLVRGYNVAPPPGKYVRPGPNQKPRLYNIKNNMGLVTAKILKAYETAGVNMPQYVSNIVLANPPFMTGAPGAKRAKNWNSRMNGHYIRPGPGRQPHFYKIPKNLRSGFKTAKKAYNDAGMNVPQHIKNVFGVTAGSPGAAGSPVAANHSVNGNKVNGRQYTRLTTAQLVAIARNLGNAGASNSMSKSAIFNRIRGIAPSKSVSPVRTANVTVNGRVYIFSNDPTNQRIIRNGRKRVFSTLTKAEREAIARTYLGNNISNVPAKNWYNAMRAKKMFPNA